MPVLARGKPAGSAFLAWHMPLAVTRADAELMAAFGYFAKSIARKKLAHRERCRGVLTIRSRRPR
jgi:hypothetical protein